MNSLKIFTFLSSGLLIGLKHAFDTDHLVAVSTMISENPNKKSTILKGSVWGLGHTSTLLFVGIFVLFFKLSISEKVAGYLEMGVGCLLIYLGISLFLKIKKDNIHIHTHEHDEKKHIHIHSHKEKTGHEHLHKSFFVGLIHGLAGSASLMLIVLATTKSPLIGTFFILIFGLGSIIGMAIFTYIISLSINLSSSKLNKITHKIKFLVASVSILIGANIVLHVF